MAGAYAVLTAAGSGTRLGADVPKALVDFQGRTLLRWAVDGLIASGVIDAVCITATPEYLGDFQRQVADLPIVVVPGGVSRQDSVRRGLLGLEDMIGAVDDAVVLVHDAARCFTPPDLIRRLVEAVDSGIAAVVPGLPVTDTIKQVTVGETELALVTGTPDRQTLRRIQTPQAFRWGVLRSAHERFREIGLDEAVAATDDAALVEMLGERVWVCPGDPRAAKITTAEDLLRAEGWVKQ